MQKINTKVVISTILAIILIGTITFIFIYKANNKKNEPLIAIDNVNFTLNNIKEKFLESEYSNNNNCNGYVYDNGIMITCNKVQYDFLFNGFELELSTNQNANELFKYFVDSIEQLHGYAPDEYLNTMDKFFSGTTSIIGLDFSNNNGNNYYSVYVLEPLEKYKEKDIVTEENIKNLEDYNYEFQSLGYTINNIELKKDSEEYLVIFSGVIGGQDNYDVNFTIKFYDTANNLVVSETLDLSSYDSFGRPSMGFVATARLDNQETFNSITKYSISLSK